MSFVHLHNHTHYSLLDAMTIPEQLVIAAKENGHPAVALSDHGVMFGTVEFYKAAKKHGIKPIIGMEAYIANGSRHDKDAMKAGVKRKNYYHILLHAKNEVGYKNLVKLTSYAHTEGFYYKPRIDKELLEKHKEGLICTSACMGSMVNQHLLDGNIELAYEEAKFYKELFGDDFYVEIQNHFLEKDKMILEHAPKMAKMFDAKLVATNDIHYLKREHAIAHNVLLHIRDTSAANAGKTDIHKLRYGKDQFYYKSTEEMQELFKDHPEAISNTLEVADKCNFELQLGKIFMPSYEIPKESKAETLEAYLEELTIEMLAKRFDDGIIPDEYMERAKYELGVINDMGFPGYFLIVYDFINAARERNVPVGPGRGSAAGSLVAYALKITNVDPIKYDLLFERFLNPERVSMPDVDIDFSDDKRDIVIKYVKDKYGADAVAQIVTFGKLSSKAVLTDVGRVLGVELSKIKEITSKIPTKFGKVFKLTQVLEMKEFDWLKNTKDPKMKTLIEISLLLENKFRHTGIHAAGVVIAPGDVSDYVPLYQPPKANVSSIDIATQYSMSELEEAGLLKMDFLGLRTLSIIENTVKMIEENHHIKIDVENRDDVPLDDPETYAIMSRGDTQTIFQFESGGMQDYLKQLKPNSLEEITAMNALYRPGPMENIPLFIDRKYNRKPTTYLHPIMEPVLKNTYGIIVYQEQVMQLVQSVAGFSLGQADVLRRAMGKKKHDIMNELKPQFIKGAQEKQIDSKTAIEIWDLIEKFADYGFNKSHSLAYSYVAYQTAWLKAHYPAEFLAANMSAELNDQDKIVQIKDECKKFNIKLLPPDVNRSFATFRATGNEIYFGMAGIKNVGVSAVDSIVEAREEKLFDSFFDFVSRVDTRLINKRTLEALVCAGAFDTLHKNRASLFASIESAMDYAKAIVNSSNQNMDSLFTGGAAELPQEPPLPDVEDWDEKEKLDKEKEVLNFYITGHPLHRYEMSIRSMTDIQLAEQSKVMDGQPIVVGGIFTELRKRRDKKDRSIAFVMLEDFSGKAECIFWSKAYEENEYLIEQDKVVLVEGKINKKEDTLKIVVDRVIGIEEAIERSVKGYKIFLNIDEDNADCIEKLYNVVNGYKEDNKCIFEFHITDNRNDMKRTYEAQTKFGFDHESTKKLIKLFHLGKIRYLYNRGETF